MAVAISHTEMVAGVEVVGSDLRVWSLVISLTEPKTRKPDSSWRLQKLFKTQKSVSCTYKI